MIISRTHRVLNYKLQQMSKINLLLVFVFILFAASCSNTNKEKTENDSDKDKSEEIQNETTVKEIVIMDTISLPEPDYDGKMTVETAMMIRRSVRDYKTDALSLAQISQILWASYGLTMPIDNAPKKLRGGLRTAPAAGALYPLEIYLVAGNVEGLKAGIYKYNSEKHVLLLLEAGDKRKELMEAALNQKFLEQAPASILWSAVYERTSDKYGERAVERYVCMDLGHSAQNVYLQATAIGLASCAVGAFTDEMISSLVNLPAEEEPLYIMPIGKSLKELRGSNFKDSK